MPNLDLKIVIVEYWSVSEENMDRFRYFYDNIFLNCLTHASGYSGTIVQERSYAVTDRIIGGGDGTEPRRVVAPHPFLHQLGVRTDAMIDFDALLQHEYNVVATHLLHSTATLETLFPQFVEGYQAVQPNWREEHPNVETVEDAIVEDFFSIVDNHWDVFYDVHKVFWNEGKSGPVAPLR